MADLTPEELTAIAQLSGLTLDPEEIKVLPEQIKQILDYVDTLKTVDMTEERIAVRPINVLRDDVAIKRDAQRVLDLAPQTEDNYFVVPRILKDK